MKPLPLVLAALSLCCIVGLIAVGRGVSSDNASVSPKRESDRIDRTISTSGTVTRSVMPDTIFWNISLRDRHEEVAEVKKISDEKLQRVLALKQELEIAHDDMQVCHMQLHRRTETIGHGNHKKKVHYYEITRNVTVRLMDLSRFDEFFNEFVGIGGVEVSYRMDSSKAEQIREKVRQGAFQVAQQKAHAAARELGVELGPARTVHDHRPQRAVHGYGGGSSGARSSDKRSGVVAPSAIDVTASIDVVFDLRVASGR